MMKRLLLPATALFVAAIPALSQGPGGPGMDHGPMNGPMNRGAMSLGPFGMRNPVTNAPYSATFTSTSKEALQDGTVLNTSTSRTVARDSLGRTREEITLPARGRGQVAGTTHTVIVIMDPVTHTVTQLRPDEKVAVVRTLPQPPQGGFGPRRGPGAGGTTPPTGDSAASGKPRGPHEDPNVTRTDLGSMTVSGLVATGKRTTRTIPAGEMGNATPIISTHEEWYSPDLQIEVSRTDVDPFHGTRSVVASELTKAEPSASLFTVPTGYTVQQAPDHARRGPGEFRRGEMPPPPPMGGTSPAPPAL